MQRQITIPQSLFSCPPSLIRPALILALLASLFGAAAAFVPDAGAPPDARSAAALSDTTAAQICQGEFYLFGGDSLTASGLYNDTLVGSDGMDSVATLDLTVLPVPTTGIETGICAGSTYIFGDDTLSHAGVYVDTLTAGNGCDSIVTLQLRVEQFFDDTLTATICEGEIFIFGADTLNMSGIYTDSLTAAGGCDSIVTLLLDVVPLQNTVLQATICADETFLFGGDTLNQSGTYVDTLPGAAGCDSLVTLKLEVLPLADSVFAASICFGENYDFNGQMLTQSGVYSDTLTAENGCDSTVTLTLTVLPVWLTNLEASICEGTFYPFGDTVYSESGVYVDTLKAVNGCDSTVTLTLTVAPFFEDTTYATICENDIYLFGADTLKAAGIYSGLFIAAGGCDSTVTLFLEVAPLQSTDLNAEICANEFYDFGGESLNQPGVYIDTLSTVAGCDSIVTLTLNVLPTADSSFAATICANESYDFNGTILTESGIYSDTLQAENSCDSIATLTLTVLPAIDSTLDVALCAFQTYEFDGQILDVAGVYTATFTAANGCDSTVTLNLTVFPEQTLTLNESICTGETYDFNGVPLDQPGVYSLVIIAPNGCDSVILLNLAVYPTADSAFNATICANESFDFGGQSLHQAGIYVDTLATVNGCDSVVTLTLAVLPTADSAFSATICSNEAFDFNGQSLGQAGIYTDTLTAENGCDSLVTLTLDVLPAPATALEATICDGKTYDFNGETLTAAGIYRDTFALANGCDSVVTLTLTVLPVQDTALTAQICEGTSLLFNSQLLTESGVYTAVYPGANGCDSTVTLSLNVLPVLSSELDATICSDETYAFNGLLLDQSGVYMAAYPTGGGCDSIVTLTLTVLPVSNTTLDVDICPGESYAFGGQLLTASGTYTDSLSNLNGCDSIVTLNLTVLTAPVTALDATICSDESYLFNGENLNQSGVFTAVLTAANGCDSTVTLSLTVLPIAATALNATICSDETYFFNGENLNQSGVYVAVLNAANGCDSTVTLSLNVLPVAATALSATICAGESYPYNGENLTDAGVYQYTFTAANGCDSLVTLTLDVLPSPTTELSFSICQGTNFQYGGDTLTQTGVYTFQFTTTEGCDSTVTVDLFVIPAPTTTLTYAICEGTTFVYQNDTLTQSGAYTFYFIASTGCDSTVTVNLNVLPTSASTVDASICQGETYLFDGQLLTAEGVYTAVLSGANGCDSTAVLHLTVLPIAETPLSAEICAGESYPFAGVSLTQPGVYTVIYTGPNGCDSLVTLTLTVNEVLTEVVQQSGTLTALAANATFQWIDCATGLLIAGSTGASFTPDATGSYAVIVGQNGCADTSDCYFVEVIATIEPGLVLAWTLQPNPASEQTMLRLPAPAGQDLDVALYDLNGRQLLRRVLPQGATALELDLSGLPSGILLVQLADGRHFATKRLVKAER